MKGTKPVIGLAGGIGSGKTLVAKLLADLGAGVIDSDRMNDQVLAREDIRRQLRTWWGETIFDDQGRCNRKKLSSIVFDNETERVKLEGLTHPLIEELRKEAMQQLEEDPHIAVIVIDSPLLFEARLNELCDKIIFVEADEQSRLHRKQQDRGWNQAELRRREKLQNPLDSKRNQADYIVENNSDLNTLRQKVEKIYCQMITPFSRPSNS